MSSYDAVVVGAGPNGLGAAIELARHGLEVLLVEANETVGGAARTEEATLPGFRHDIGSAVHPLGAGSPFLSDLPLNEHGLQWVRSEAPLAHPLDGGRLVTLEHDLEATARALGSDGDPYRRLFEPLVTSWATLREHVLDSPVRVPDAPWLMLRFALLSLRGTSFLSKRFATPETRALIAGNAAHTGQPLDQPLVPGVALTLMAAGHVSGWPVPRGGAGAITEAMASYFRSLGGTIETGRPVSDLDSLPSRKATLLALTHRQVAALDGSRLPDAYRARLREWIYGPGAFKVDWALDEPIPWAAPDVSRAITVHVGGTAAEITDAERAPSRGKLAERPFVLLAQPSLADPTRAPDGKHTAWGYCHVPNRWDGDGAEATEAIEAQIERFAPGFREVILARAVHSTTDLERWDANLVGGDVNGGALTVDQVLGPRRWTRHPWSTPVPDLYVCSASRPPGGGVHGMVGFHAAREALARTFGITLES